MIKELFKYLQISLLATIVVGAAALYFMGPSALFAILVLCVIEITFSFDNAIINAKVLHVLSPLWQKLFLTLGIIIAVFGMRLLFPVLLIVITSHTGLSETVDLALYHPAIYAEKLALAHPAISAFGGTFLLVLALNFFMLDRTRPLWIKHLEAPLKYFDRQWAVIIVALLVLLLMVALPANLHAYTTLAAGVSAVIVFFIIHTATSVIPRRLGKVERRKAAGVSGWAALATFLYLEVLDASFSLDGVLGAFAVTNNVLLIAAGLGIGAVWVRSLTVYMLKKGVVKDYIYIEHGAHYAILLLALSLLLGVFINVPSFVIGTLGLIVIFASILSSLKSRRQLG